MKQMIPAVLSAIVLALAAGSADAQIVNGNFNGLAGWSTGGDAASVGGSRLVLTNALSDGSDDAANVNVSGNDPLLAGGDLETFVGVPAGAFDPDTANFVVAYEGSAAMQSFMATAGSRVSFTWDLGTLETSTDPAVADAAYVVIDGQVIKLADTLSAATPIAGGSFASETGWMNASYTLTGSGPHSIAFVIADVGAFNDSSALSVTGVTLAASAVPESSTFALFGAGLGLLGLQRRRRQV